MKLSSALPDDELNGLGKLALAMVKEPHDRHFIIAQVDAQKLITETDTGNIEPVMRVRAVEAPLTPGLEQRARELFDDAWEARQGKKTLPFDNGEV